VDSVVIWELGSDLNVRDTAKTTSLLEERGHEACLHRTTLADPICKAANASSGWPISAVCGLKTRGVEAAGSVPCRACLACKQQTAKTKI
jgi:hypothetical protein